MFEKHKRKAIIKAVIKKLPLVKRLRTYKTRGSDEAQYCYDIWLRHLSKYYAHLNKAPSIVAELGPGDSIGVVLAALITGADKVYAFDVMNNCNTELNLLIFDQLVELFRNKAKIPGPKKYPRVIPFLDHYDFPSDIISDTDLDKLLHPERILRIRQEISDLEVNNYKSSMIIYQAPWNNLDPVAKGTVDLILSQAVMEHVLDIEKSYEAMYEWLKPGGAISHSIDFKCHDMSTVWNGHWFYEQMEWSLVQDDEGPAINRTSYLDHVKRVESLGFDLIVQVTNQRKDGFSFSDYKKKFPNSDRIESEIITESIYLLASKSKSA
jgi:SAM-dependent methyltransferase